MLKLYLAEALIASSTPRHPHRVCPRVGILQRFSFLFAEDELVAGGRVERLHTRGFPRDLVPLLLELSLLEHLIPRLKCKFIYSLSIIKFKFGAQTSHFPIPGNYQSRRPQFEFELHTGGSDTLYNQTPNSTKG